MVNEEKKVIPEEAVNKENAEKNQELDKKPKGKEDGNEEEKKEEEVELLNVLIIDDSKALRKAITRYIQHKFYCNIFEADHGKDGLQIIAEKKGNIKLILCDLMMPVMDGMTFMKTLRSNTALQGIPVIFLTAKNDSDTVKKCISLGASDFIVKPYDLVAISKKITKFLTPR